MTSPKPILLLLTTLALGGCDVTSGSLTGAGPTASTGMFGIASDGVMARAYAGSRSLLDTSRGAIGSALNGVGLGSSANLDSPTNPTSERALRGLLGDRLGATLDDGDWRFATQAQLAALDRSAPGAPTPWRNPASGHSGIIVAGPFYERGGVTCRGFSHSISLPVGAESVRGTACRSAGGAWAAAG